MRVLFVCDNNVCSSPLAAGFLYHQARLGAIDTLIVASAGFGPAGRRINRPVVTLLEDRGVDAEHKRTRMLNLEMVERADVVISMTAAQARRAAADFPDATSRIFTLRHLCALVTTRPDGIGAEAWMRELQRTNPRDYEADDVTQDISEPVGSEFGAVLNLADQLLVAIDHLARCLWPRSVTAT